MLFLNIHMRKKILSLAAVLGTIALLGAGCAGKETAQTTNQPPSILVSAQDLKADNQVVIDKASIDDNGWVVIHAKQNGLAGAVLGYTALLKGSSSKIKVTIDSANLSPSLIAMLHYDRGQKGVFEFPGDDGPVIRDQQVIMGEFNLSNFAEVTKVTEPPATVGRKEFIITAKQWSFSPSVIKVKKGDKVVLKLKTIDVAHSYSIPEFGINADIKPRETTVVEFTADKAGTFTSSCKVYCGVGHMGMTGTLIVE